MAGDDDTPNPFVELFDLRQRILEAFRPSARTAEELVTQLQRTIKVDPEVLACFQRMHRLTADLA